MLRIRIGQHWKHEGAADALDGFSLELDGVALVLGASEEPLGVVMEQLLSATAALAAGQPMAQVSLPESAQQLLLLRHDDQLQLHVLRLGRPAGAVRGPVTLDAAAWRVAVVRAARGWTDDLRASAAPGKVRQKARGLLARADREWPPGTERTSGWGLRLEPRSAPGFRLEATDPDGLLSGTARQREAVPVAILALPGRVELVFPGALGWELGGATGLLALELLRQGEEVVRALEAGERTLRLSPAGGPVGWQLDLVQGTLQAPGFEMPWPASHLAQALVEPALGLATLLPALEPRLSENNYLSDFTTRGRGVLAALRALVARPTDEPPVLRRRPRSPPTQPLQRGAALRKLSFQRRGQTLGLAGEGQAALQTLGDGFVLVAGTRAAVVNRTGELLSSWEAPHGVAHALSGEAVLGVGERLLGVQLERHDARWFRDHDGSALEGPLLSSEDQLLFTTRPTGVRAINRWTGSERWRFLPQGAQQLHLGLHAGRLLVASSSGSVHGLDLVGGSVRFRIAAPLPCLGPPVAWGRAAATALGRGTRMAVLVLDPHAGTVRWIRELPLACAAAPLARGARIRVLGQRDGTPVLVSLRRGGATEWERPLPLGGGPFTLSTDADASLVTAADGSAVRLDAQGRLEWHVVGQPSSTGAPAVFRRRVLLLPGEAIRAVDVRSGRVLAEIASPGGIHALAANELLDVAVLDAAGDLTLWNLGAHLGVVEPAVP